MWVEKYFVVTHGRKQADVILDDIDRRLVIYILEFLLYQLFLVKIALVAPFSGLRRFSEG